MRTKKSRKAKAKTKKDAKRATAIVTYLPGRSKKRYHGVLEVNPDGFTVTTESWFSTKTFGVGADDIEGQVRTEHPWFVRPKVLLRTDFLEVELRVPEWPDAQKVRAALTRRPGLFS